MTRRSAKLDTYSQWLVAYASPDGEVRMLRLDGSKPRHLFRENGAVSLKLWTSNDGKTILCESAYPRRSRLSVFSNETGKQHVITEDLGYVIGFGETEVFFTSPRPSEPGKVFSCAFDSKKPRLLFEAAPAFFGTQPLPGYAIFCAARSDYTQDPVDQDVYLITGKDKITKIASLPRLYGVEGARYVSGGQVIYGVVELAGATFGDVMRWTESTKSTEFIARNSAILDITSDGAILVLESSVDVDTGKRSEHLVYYAPGGDVPVPLGDPIPSYPTACIAGRKVVVAYDVGEEQRMDCYDTQTGRKTELFRSDESAIGRIDALDEHAVICTTDPYRNAPKGSKNELLWMPLDGSKPVVLDETESGPFEVATPVNCKS